MRNPLTWLFGYTETSNPDVIGRVSLTADEIDAERLKAHEKKLHRARAYIRLKKLGIKPLYQFKEH